MEKYSWLAIAIGNSRLHWAWFKHDTLVETGNTRHLSNMVEAHLLPQFLLSERLGNDNHFKIPVYLASVVPQQTKLWQNYSQLNLISLQDIKLTNVYPQIGIDRALAVWAASVIYNCPCLTIDGGTALTFTGVDGDKKLVGGSILPGLGLQLTTLQQNTAALPKVELGATLPPRWATNTEQAIASGIVYTAISGIHSYIIDWLNCFPNSKIIFTGGDADLLSSYLHSQFPAIAQQTLIEPNLVFLGIDLVYQSRYNPQKY